MQYDLFISYSRRDNLTNRVTELKEKIEAEYLEFAKEELKCFFDKEVIKGMEDWKQRLMEGLKDSHLLLIILSPNYLESDYCEWEIVEYLKYEYARATQGDGVAQIYFMEIQGLEEQDFQHKAKAWLEKVSRRQRFDFRPWYNDGADSLKETDVKNRLEELKISLRERIQRMRRIASAPGNLPAPNVRFVGREREMKLLHESVGLGKFGILTAVHGMGGLGKTAIAFQYAYAYADFYPGGRWQIGCANETNLAAVLKKLELDLKVTFTEEEKKDDIRGAKRILNELEALAFKGVESVTGDVKAQKPTVLLLLDNVDHSELLQLPDVALISGKPWLKVLVTTRMGPEELGADETRQTLLTIDELPFEDALSLIESYQPHGRFKNEEEKLKAGEIVDLLGCFTLAVEVAALYLYERKGQISCADFLELLKRKGNLEGIDFAGDKTKAKTAIDHTKLITATLSPTLDLLSPAETLVLSYAALLPPDSIPLPWIKTLVTKDFPELDIHVEIGEDDPWLLIVNHLLSLRLLQIVDLDGQTPRVVRMHRLNGEIILKRKKETIQLIRDQLTDNLKNRCNDLEKKWHKYQWEIMPIVGYANSLLEIQDHKAAKLVRSLCQWLPAYDRGRYSEPILRATIQYLEAHPSDDHKDLSVTLSNLGWALMAVGKYEESEKYLRHAIAIDEGADPNDFHALAVRYINLGSCLDDLGKFYEAKELNIKAIAILSTNFGNEHPLLANGYNNLALVEMNLGNLSEAKELILKAIAILKKILVRDHPDLAKGYSNLASVEMALGNLSEAKGLNLKTLAIWEKVLAMDHPSLATSYANLASVEESLGNLIEAKELNLKAITIWEKVFGKDHPHLAISYNNLALIEQNLKNYESAELYFRLSLDIRKKVYPENHPTLANGYASLARLLAEIAKDKEGEDYAKLAISIWKQSEVKNDPRLGKAFWALGIIELHRKNKITAYEHFMEGLRLLRLGYAEDHLWIRSIKDELAKLEQNDGN